MARLGRPSKFKTEYCQLLVDHMSQGLSFEAFGGVAMVATETLYTWSKKHKSFMEAKSLGESLSRLFWERAAVAASLGKIPNCIPSVLIFALKNKLRWRDKHDADDEAMNSFEPIVIELPLSNKKLEIKNKI